ncbi:MAG: IclR family transcriptional regulator [Pseudomonadota bacterium]
MSSQKAAGQSAPVARENDSSGIQVLSRAVDILRAVGAESKPPSLGKIATLTGLPRSTVQRIVSALLAEGMLGSGPNGMGFFIGGTIHQLAEIGRPDVRKSLHQLLELLSEATGETVDLAICRDHQMVFIDQVSGKQRLRAVSAIGERFPMTVTANGKAVLAMKSAASIQEIVALETAGKLTTLSLSAVKKELIKVHQNGYGLDLDEHTPGISAVGIAFSVNGAYYAISIPAPTHRFKQHMNEFTDHLLQAKDSVSRLLPDCVF